MLVLGAKCPAYVAARKVGQHGSAQRMGDGVARPDIEKDFPTSLHNIEK